MIGGYNSFGKPICSICYEDLKPIAEDLQSISICGHVFHELCLQQWFEYCSNPKKRSCPVCKQHCLSKDAFRLYFQSIGDQSDSFASQKAVCCEKDPETLRREVKRLEGKVSGLATALESQTKETIEVTEELLLCKEQLKKEVEEKKEALRERTTNQHLLQLKSEECCRLTSECARLHERTMDMAKELAALKLVSDLNLEEDDVLKLGSLGNESKTKHTVETLAKSLVIRNRSYKELLAKCNLLGRGEARSSEKLQKAMAKIHKLKKHVKELERIVEEKENGALRALKASRKSSERSVFKHEDDTSNLFSTRKLPSDDFVEHISIPMTGLERTERLINGPSWFKEREGSICNYKPGANALKEDPVILIDADLPKVTMQEFGHSNANSKHQESEDIVQKSGFTKYASLMPGITSVANTEPIVQEKNSTVDNLLHKDAMFNIRKESPSSVSLCRSGDICFSGGLLGPDGTNRYLGKWCKRGQSKVSGGSDLIAVGSDGRGGRIKVLRSQVQSSLDGKENSVCAKRFKYGARTNNSQSQGQGCLQIEHFFGRVNH